MTRTKERYDSDIEFLKRLEDEHYTGDRTRDRAQIDIKPRNKRLQSDSERLESFKKAVESLKYNREMPLPPSCDWRTARETLGLSEKEWEEQVGDIPDDVTHITCFLSFKDRIRRKLGMKPKDEIPILMR